MGLNYSTLVYLPSYELFARPVIIMPLASQPGMPSYGNRGIFDSGTMNVPLDDGSILSDQQTILDIRESEYGMLPVQGDLVDIPADAGVPAEGAFEIINAWRNGGGETTLQLRRIEVAG
jgi:hypothetical protein